MWMCFFFFFQESYNTTQVTISGLYPVTTYRFQVFAENGVSDQGRDPQYVDITVTTEASGEAICRIEFKKKNLNNLVCL